MWWSGPIGTFVRMARVVQKDSSVGAHPEQCCSGRIMRTRSIRHGCRPLQWIISSMRHTCPTIDSKGNVKRSW